MINRCLLHRPRPILIRSCFGWRSEAVTDLQSSATSTELMHLQASLMVDKPSLMSKTTEQKVSCVCSNPKGEDKVHEAWHDLIVGQECSQHLSRHSQTIPGV